MITLIALNYWEQFFIIFFFVTTHEFAHIFTAYLFGYKTEKIIITPIGEISKIQDIDKAKNYKKIIIFLSGPLINLISAIIFIEHKTVFYTNTVLFIFNMLPVVFLDGGQIIKCILSEINPFISYKIRYYISLFIGYFTLLLGIIQIMLFKYNISLLLLGIYIIKQTKNNSIYELIQIYKLNL